MRIYAPFFDGFGNLTLWNSRPLGRGHGELRILAPVLQVSTTCVHDSHNKEGVQEISNSCTPSLIYIGDMKHLQKSGAPLLMMEQTNTSKCHCHIVFIATLNYSIITNRSAWLRDIFDTALLGTFDIIREWEKGI